jgi:serine/threonine protein phosphatase PrpC
MNPTPVTSIVELRKGDTLLLCSDGLTKHVGNQQMAEALLTSKSAEDACERLLHDALQDGGRDNITIVVSRFGQVRTIGHQGDVSQSMSGTVRVNEAFSV